MSTASTLTSKKPTSVASKVTGISISSFAFTLLVLCMAISVVTTHSTKKQLRVTLENVAETLADTVDAVDASSRRVIESAGSGLADTFSGSYSLESGQLLLDGIPITNKVALLDTFSKAAGTDATVFIKDGSSFTRVITTLKHSNGSRLTGTKMDPASPAYEKLVANDVYLGRSIVADTPYMSRYAPILDNAGHVVGALFVGIDLSKFQAGLQNKVKQASVFTSGGMMIIDTSKGLDSAFFVAHPRYESSKVVDHFPNAAATLKSLSEGTSAQRPQTLLGTHNDTPWLVAKQAENGWLAVVEVSDSEVMAEQNSALMFIWVAMATALGLLALLQYWASNRIISRPLHELNSAVEMLASGNLQQPFTSYRTDDVGTLIKSVESLRERYVSLLYQVREAAHSIASASNQVAQGNSDLSERTESTATSLARTAQNIEEVSQSVQQSAQAADQAQRLSTSAVSIAREGGTVAGKVSDAMVEIRDRSVKIQDIISVIDSIAFQTNILALNAAVEAARAGEQGRGFAVVASEVRALAKRSADAAKEIKGLIEDSMDKVTEGESLVTAASATMRDIGLSITKVSDLIAEVAAGAKEQVTSVGDVNSQVSRLDQLTQQNAALVEESAAAAQSMRDQASGMEKTIAVFKLP